VDQLTLLRAQWDRATAVLALSAAAVTLVVVWWRTSGQSFPTQQVPMAFSSGIATVLLLTLGATLWVSAALRDEWRRLHAIERRLAAGGSLADETPVTALGMRQLVGLQRDRLIAVGLLLCAVAVAFIGWYEIAGQGFLAAQLPYVISSGAAAVVLAGGGGTCWVSADLVDQWRLLDRMKQGEGDPGAAPGVSVQWRQAMDELNGSERSLGRAPRHRDESVFTRSIPWRVGDLLSLVRTLLVAAGLWAVTWVGASGTDDVQHQVTWTAVGLGAGVVAGVGYAAWVLVGVRTVRARRRFLIDHLAAPEVEALVKPPAREGFLAAANMTRYHLPGCPLVQGKVVEARTAAAHRRARRQPCGVCRP
jgi:hypothetical protein